MEFRVVDFDILTRHYNKYQEGVKEINKMRTDFLDKLEPIKKEMNDIIRYAQSGIVVGNKNEQEQQQRFQDLQQELYRMDGDYKAEVNKMSTELNETCFEDLSKIIKDWSIENSIDIVLGKMEVVYNTDNYEITDDILNVLKKNGSFEEYIEEEN